MRKIKLYPLTFIILVNLCLILIAGCQETKTTGIDHMKPSKITVKKDQFIDNYGRQVILNGINVVSKDKDEGYIFEGGPEFYSNLKKWGFNSIRFIIIWDGLEPEPGVYDEDYLKEIDKRIKWAGENGLFVILDMHQDLFSVKYADGAPEWATLDEGKEHITGDVWSDAYMMSPAVQTAFDNFWANKPAPDGVGVQDHYAQLWKHVAKRYANNATVIGFDLMNEPFPGSQALKVMPAILNTYGKLLYERTGKQQTEEQLVETWSNVEKRTEALKLLDNKKDFAKVIDALYPLAKSFETEKLQPFYEKVTQSIREVDSVKTVFLEHSYYGNMGVKSSIRRPILSNGEPDPLVAYAPHGYDLVTDTENAADASAERVAFIYNRIKENGARLEMPIWLGEWGAYYAHGKKIVGTAQQAIGEIEKNLFGNAYWSYDPNMENQAYFQKAIIRPYPSFTNGELLNYNYHFSENIFTAEWKEDQSIQASTIIFIPWLSQLHSEELDESFQIQKIDGSDAGWIIVPPSNKPENRRIKLNFNKDQKKNPDA